MESYDIQKPSIINIPVKTSSVIKSDVYKGHFSPERNKAWTFDEDHVQVINTNSGIGLQEWKCTYGKIYHVNEVIDDIDRFLVVTSRMYSESDLYVLVLLNFSSLSVVRSVYFTKEVTCLCTQIIDKESCSNYDGALAVGSCGGRVHLVNLNLTEVEGSIHHQSPIDGIGDRSNNGRQLLQEFIQDDNFVYQQVSFSLDDVYVTAIYYAKHLSSLFIGFNFGCFVVFNMSEFTITYMSPCSPEQLLSPVTHFVYMEPENDPKCFVYIWVSRGNIQNTSLLYETKLTLYQLIFSQKSDKPFYIGFQGCAPRMEYALTSTPTTPNPQISSRSKLINCFITKKFRQVCDLSSSLGYEEDYTIAAFIWSTEINDHHAYFIALFDINQWYQAQMPNAVRWRKSSGKYNGCSYFAFFSLDDLTKNARDILDVSIKRISSYPSQSPVPQTHMWPSSMKLCVQILKREDILSCTFLGLPRLAWNEIVESQSSLFSIPNDVFDLCIKADLVAEYEEDLQSLDIRQKKQKYLLNMILDQDCPSCVFGYLIENISSSDDCVIIEWVSDRINKMILEEEDMWSHISATQIPPLSLLQKLETLQRFLDSILVNLAGDSLGINKRLSEKYSIICFQKKVTEIISFCISNGVFGSSTTCDEISSWRTLRNKRPISSDSRPQLAIEHICNELNSHYPPNSTSDFLGIFKSSNLKAIHSFILYLFLDLETQYNISFIYSECMCLPYQLVQVTEVFWMIDHQKYMDLGHHNFFSLCCGERMFEWQHEFVLDKLLNNGMKALSLMYICQHGRDMQDVEEIKKKIYVYVANERIDEAHNVVKYFRDSQYHEDLFLKFVTLCDQGEKFHLIWDVKFSDTEEALMTEHLETSENYDLHVLLFYYLMNCRFSDAVKVYDNIIKSLNLSSENEVADVYIHMLLNFCDNFAQEKHLTSKSSVEVDQSFSVTVGKVAESHQVISNMGIIYNILKKRLTSKFKPITESNVATSLLGDKYPLSCGEDVHTPLKVGPSVPKTKEDSTSFSHVHDFKNRIAKQCSLFHGDSPLVGTPEFYKVCKPPKHAFTSTTPSSILKRFSGNKGELHNRSIRFAIETPETMSTIAARSTSYGPVEGESEDSDDFGSPLESLLQETSYRELLRLKECETSSDFMPEITPGKNTLDDSYIQLTSHAANSEPVQSDMTNKMICSANTPSNSGQSATWTSKHSILSSPVHDSQYSFSSPMELNKAPEKLIQSSSLYVFSPPLTRSATRKTKKTIEDTTSTIIDLVSPPSMASNSSYTKKNARQRKPKGQTAGIGIRRSARLLKGKK